MAYLLFAMFEGGGNVPLLTPVVDAVAARGHEVGVLVGPNIRRPAAPPPSERFLDRLRASGARVIPLGDVGDPLAGFELRSAAFGRTPDGLFGATDVDRLARWSGPWAQAVTGEIAAARPDALVCDFFLLGALAAGEASGVSTVALVHNSSLNWPLPGLPLPPPGSMPRPGAIGWVRDRAWAAAYNRVARRDGLRPVNEARAQLGLAALRRPYEQVERAARVLVLSSPALELPVRAPLPANVRHIGTILGDSPDSQWSPPADDGRPLLLVSLSTLPQGQGPVLRRVLQAIGELPVRAVVTLGPTLARESFEVPPNAVTETFVPHDAVLPHVSAVVTQCGLGTVTKVLAAGLPMVCLPVLGDQPANAARVAAIGAGLRLSKEASASDIADAVRRVVGDEKFRQAAQRFAAVVADEDPRQALLEEIEAITGVP